MKFEPELTEGMRRYLEAEPSDRDNAEAAKILLRVSGNIHLYNQIMRTGPDRMAPLIERKLKDYYQFRLAKLTHEEVKRMSSRAEVIVKDTSKREEEIRSGRRPDHDSLPDEIRAAYAEALGCLHSERELHLQIRRLALSEATCPDSEIYPFVKEIIRLDDRRLALWRRYDEYGRKQD